MSDDDDILDGGSGIDSGSKKSSRLGGLLPKLLKMIAIGLGALIFIVTVAVITFNFLNKGGRSQTVVSDTDPYVGRRPEYMYFTALDSIRTRTYDPTPFVVVVKINLGYDMNDRYAQTELTNRQYEIIDFLRTFFSLKTAAELGPENQARLKQEIREELNARILQNTRVREVLFQQFDVTEI